jgi:hypothetical protein
MSIRHEDGKYVLRLFSTKEDAMRYPNAHNLTAYGAGFIVQNENNRWVDADGLIPEDWEPDPEQTFLLT